MLILLFKIGDEHFAMATASIREIAPLVRIKKVPSAPAYFSGIMNYHGKPVPVIDLCLLSSGLPFVARFSTRIILIDYLLANGQTEILGLIAENIFETVKSKLTKPPIAGVIMEDLLNQSGLQLGSDQMIQWLDPQQILPVEVVNNLFGV